MSALRIVIHCLVCSFSQREVHEGVLGGSNKWRESWTRGEEVLRHGPKFSLALSLE